MRTLGTVGHEGGQRADELEQTRLVVVVDGQSPFQQQSRVDEDHVEVKEPNDRPNLGSQLAGIESRNVDCISPVVQFADHDLVLDHQGQVVVQQLLQPCLLLVKLPKDRQQLSVGDRIKVAGQ